MTKYRPWGKAPWIFDHFHNMNWSIIGCLSTENRSVSFIEQFSHLQIRCAKYAKIYDPDPVNIDQVNKQLEANQQKISKVFPNTEFKKADLKSSLDFIKDFCTDFQKLGENIILDVTSFPKRWFFPIVRFLSTAPTVKNFVITYTRAGEYADTISENPEIVRAIPSFAAVQNRTEHDLAFIGVGHQSMSILSLFAEERAGQVQLLFPFPPGPPNFRRNWLFVEQTEKTLQTDTKDEGSEYLIGYKQVSAHNLPLIFDVLDTMTNNGQLSCFMAPYGPKPMSLAMCLFSIAVEIAGLSEIPVFYSQPQRYAIDYTKNPKQSDGKVEIDAFCIKAYGTHYYML